MDIFLLKRASKSTEDGLNILKGHQNPRIKERAKSRLSDLYEVVISCFHSILHLKA